MKLFELKTPAEVQALEQYLDQLMYPVGLDVEFSRHFIERLLGREKPVTVAEVVSAFTKLKQKYKRKLIGAKKKPGYNAVLKDFDNDLNIAFRIKPTNDGLPELVNITIMRKKPDEFGIDNYPGQDELKVGTQK